MKYSINFLLIFTLIIIGIFLKFYQLGSVPKSLYWDELAIGNDAYAISQTGKDINGNNWLQAIYPSYGDYKAPVAIWLTAISFKIFGMSEWSLRLPFLLSGLVLWISLSLLAREFLQILAPKLINVWWYINMFILFNPWMFHFSRIGFESGMSFGFLTLAILLIYRGLIKNKMHKICILLGFLFAIVSLYAYFSAKYIFPVILFSLLIIYWQKFIKKRQVFVIGLIFYIIAQIWILKSPLYKKSQSYRLSTPNIFNTYHYVEQSNHYITKYGRNILTRILFHRYIFLTKDFSKNYIKYFSPSFLFINGDSNLRHHSGYSGQLLLVFLPFLLIGMFYIVLNLNKNVVLLALFWLLFTPVIAAIPMEGPHASRSIYMFLPLTLVFGFSLIQISQWLNKKSAKLFIYFSIILFLVNFSLYVYDYFYKYPVRSENAWQFGNTELGKLVTGISNKQNIWIAENFWMPVNAVLFYNPQYILDIQRKTISGKLYNTYWWVRGFNKIHFGIPRKQDIATDDIVFSDVFDKNIFKIIEKYKISDQLLLYKLKLR